MKKIFINIKKCVNSGVWAKYTKYNLSQVQKVWYVPSATHPITAFGYLPDLASRRSLIFSTPASPYSSSVARVFNLNRGELVNRGDLVCTIVAAFNAAFSDQYTLYSRMATVLSSRCNVRLVSAVLVCSAAYSIVWWVQCSAQQRLINSVCSAVQYSVQCTVYRAVQYSVQCSAVQCTVQCSIVYSAVQYSVQCSAVQCTVYSSAWWMQCAVSNL